MITASDRLVALSSQSGTAGHLLLLIGTGPTAGESLVNYSGLETGTAEEHLMLDRVQRIGRPFRRFLLEGIAFDIDEDDEELMMMLVAAATILHRRTACPIRTVSRG